MKKLFVMFGKFTDGTETRCWRTLVKRILRHMGPLKFLYAEPEKVSRVVFRGLRRTFGSKLPLFRVILLFQPVRIKRNKIFFVPSAQLLGVLR